jgi:hypothetical protein
MNKEVYWKRDGISLRLNGLVEDNFYQGLEKDIHEYEIDGSLSDAQLLYCMTEKLQSNLSELVNYDFEKQAIEQLQTYFSGLLPINFAHFNFLRFTKMDENLFSCVHFKFDTIRKYYILQDDQQELWVPEELFDNYLIVADDEESSDPKNATLLSFYSDALETLFMSEEDISANIDATNRVINDIIVAFNNAGIPILDFEELKSVYSLLEE